MCENAPLYNSSFPNCDQIMIRGYTRESLIPKDNFHVNNNGYVLPILIGLLTVAFIVITILYGVFLAQLRDKQDATERSLIVDPFVGTWVGHASNMSQWIQFHNWVGGLLEFHSSLDLGVPFPGFEFGAFLTSGQGEWAKLDGDNLYSTVQTQVIVAKDTSPGQFLAGIPALRIVVTGTAILSHDNNQIDGNYTVFGYAIPDVQYLHPMYLTESTYTVFRLLPTFSKK